MKLCTDLARPELHCVSLCVTAKGEGGGRVFVFVCEREVFSFLLFMGDRCSARKQKKRMVEGEGEREK